jgi:hypothetical protein
MSEEMFMIWGGTVKKQKRDDIAENGSVYFKGGVDLLVCVPNVL